MKLVGAIGPHSDKLTSAEDLMWTAETRSQTEIELYPEIVRLAHDLTEPSQEAITVGKSTTENSSGGREAALEQNLELWFHPSISKQSMQQHQPTAQAGSTLIG